MALTTTWTNVDHTAEVSDPILPGDGSYVITENLHHGNFRQTTQTTVHNITAATVHRVIRSSCYTYNPNVETVQRITDELLAGIEASHGWSRFTAHPTEESTP
ncbi:MAG: hypothetical protein M3Q39_15910 [Actinomycetota bacterium]|nr:hypothetical protein [Actinomycetota bacterium]